ncbi:MAG: Xaa-Pro peptidase family protein [Alphaproteobacteria bacterium]|nr:Xaa-Pro peptidase family protein [Alphaproteobacteria bacterium]
MLHFTPETFEKRQAELVRQMEKAGLDVLLVFRQETSYYLTGFDTFGYVFFQCLVFSTDGVLSLLCRSPDVLQAKLTSTIEDVHTWVDGPEARPVDDLHTLLESKKLLGKRVGVEYDAFGLQGTNVFQLHAMLSGACLSVVDASRIVTQMRFVKDDVELAYTRQAGKIADAMLDSAKQTAAPGVSDAEVMAEMQATNFRMDGDFTGNEPIVGSGNMALLVRYHSGRRVLDARDQLTLEYASAFRHYHACLMQTLFVGGKPSETHRKNHSVALEALHACRDAAKPGVAMGDVYEAHANVLKKRGLGHALLNATGYSLGATFSPTWMDSPMLYANNPTELQEGVVLFMHMILQDDATGAASMLGQTGIITANGFDPLSTQGITLEDMCVG